MPKIKAHRGASFDAPENTLASVELAWAQGADGAEIDVRLSGDGHPVVIHDDDTLRTGGVDRKVADQTLAELQVLDVGGWKDERFHGERLPTLAQVLAVVPAGKTLFIEIKSDSQSVSAIANVVRTASPAGSVAFESFDLPVLHAVAREFPDAPRYWLVGVRTDKQTRRKLPHEPAIAEIAASERVTGVAVDHRGVDVAFRDAVAEAGLALAVWTIDDPNTARKHRDGIEWLETNRPDLVRAALDPRQGRGVGLGVDD